MGLLDPFGIIGQRLDDQFLVEELVGEGGFTLVYKGYHLALDTPVAIKLLDLPATLERTAAAGLVKKFHEASQLCSRLSLENVHIARSIASGTTAAPKLETTVPYVVREWLVGHSLATDFARRRAKGMTGRPLAEVVTLFDGAASAIGYAHGRGIAHHHIHPGNLFLTGMSLRVLDFGVAKLLGDHASTVHGAGTPGHLQLIHAAYAAPEQLARSIGLVGPWTDVYALAIVILEALRDTPVVTKPESAEKKGPSPRPTPRSLGIVVPPEVEAILTRAVALDPSARPRDAVAFWTGFKNAALRASDARPAVLKSAAVPPAIPDLAPTEVDAEPTRRVEHSVPPPAGVAVDPKPTPASSPKPRSPTLLMFGGGNPIAGRNERDAGIVTAVTATMTLPSPIPDLAPAEADVEPTRPAQPRLLPQPDLPGEGDTTATRTVPGHILDLLPAELELEPTLRVEPAVHPQPSAAAARDDDGSSREPAIVPPALGTAPPPAARRRSPVVLGVAGVIAASVVALGAVAAYRGVRAVAAGPVAAPTRPSSSFVASSPPSPPSPPSASAAIATTSVAAVQPAASAVAELAPSPSAAAHADEAPVHSALVSSRPPAPLPVAQRTPSKPPPHAAPKPDVKTMNRAAATASLTTLSRILASCSHQGGVGGKGEARITFGPDGKVVRATVDPPFAGTPEGACVAGRFAAARVPPFEGPPETVRYTFSIPK